MAQMIITLAFETLKAQLELAGQAIVLDEFVLANVPGQDANTPIDRNETLPPASQIVFTGEVTQSGFVNPNAVIYSLIMDTGIGDFSFNWIGLRNKAQGTLAAISHIPTINKIKSVPGVKNGNSVTRSLMMSYVGAQTATGITVDAATWQIDFTARLMGIDNVERLANVDHYGKAAFLNDGYQVFKSGSSYKTKPGTGYVGGLRCHATAELVISNVANNRSIYLDASWQGGLTSQWQAIASVKASSQVLTDYVDSTGLQHYVIKLADINGAGNVIDCRTLGGMPALERKDNAATNSDIDNNSVADKHVKLTQFWRGISNKITAAFQGRTISTTGALQGGGVLSGDLNLSIKDATTKQKGAVQLSDSVDSNSSEMGATSKAVNIVFEQSVSAEARAETAELNAKKYAKGLIDSLVGGASGAYDTLKELQNELQSNDNAISALTNNIATKLDKNATAVNSEKFEGKTKVQVIAEARTGLSTNTWRPVSNSVTGTSEDVSASELAVKKVMDRANSAYEVGAAALQIDNINGMKFNPYNTSIAQLKDGRLIVWGTETNNTTLASFGCGAGHDNISGFRVIPLPKKTWKQYGIYGHVGFALATTGELYAWGSSSGTVISGLPAPYWSNMPKLMQAGVDEFIVSEFSTSDHNNSHVVLIMKNNTFRYFGTNNQGQAQNGNTSQVKTPIAWATPPGQSRSTLKELVSIGTHHNWIVWISTNGHHYVIGSNVHGQFGNGGTISSSSWVKLNYLNGKQVDQVVGGSLYHPGGNNHSNYGSCWMIIRVGTTSYFTGHNGFGEGGDAPVGVNSTAYQESNVDELTCFGGGAPTVFKKFNNTWYARGHSSEGQSGTLLEISKNWNPLLPDGLSHFNAKTYATTHGHTHSYMSDAFFVLDDNGMERLFTVGANFFGASGLGYVNNRLAAGGALEIFHPFLSKIKDITSSGYDTGTFTFVLLENGELWGAGYGGRYNLSGIFEGALSAAATNPVFKRLF